MNAPNNQLPKSELHTVTRMTIFDIQVCSLASEDDALAWVRDACPAGTSWNWEKQEDPNLAPVDCAGGNGRRHYVFIC